MAGSYQERDLEDPRFFLPLHLIYYTSVTWGHAVRKGYNSLAFQEQIQPFLLPPHQVALLEYLSFKLLVLMF